MLPTPFTTKGITLIESVVSISLLLLAITGPVTLVAHSLKASGSSREEMIATHLAEEGLEAVHSLRDNNSADDATSDRKNWMKDILNSCTNGCAVDITQHQASNVWDNKAALIKCGGGGCDNEARVYMNPATGLYRQSETPLPSPWVISQFRRTLSIVGVDNSGNAQREVSVTASVDYPGYGGKAQTVSISEGLYNWFPYLH